VFSLSEEAELFFSLDDARKLHPREMSVGKLASLLMGPYSETARVVLNPLPAGSLTRALNSLLNVPTTGLCRISSPVSGRALDHGASGCAPFTKAAVFVLTALCLPKRRIGANRRLKTRLRMCV
jgi:hypothetical protein